MAERGLAYGIHIKADVAGEDRIRNTTASLEQLGKAARGASAGAGVADAGKMEGMLRGLAGGLGGLKAFGLSEAIGAASVALAGLGPAGWVAIAALAAAMVGGELAFKGLGFAIHAVGTILSTLGAIGSQVLGFLHDLAGVVIKRFSELALGVAAAGAAAGYVMLRLINHFADYQQELRNAMSVTGLYGDALETAQGQMDQFARKMSMQTGREPKEVASAYYSLASAGMNVNETLQATPGVLALAGATLFDTRSTAELVMATLKQFRKDTSETNDVVNLFAASIGKTPLNMARLTESMQYAGPIAGALKLPLQDIVAVLGLMAQSGIYGSLAGTSLKAILTREETPPGATKKILAKYGLDLESIDPARVGLEQMIRVLQGANMTPGDVMTAFGLRAGPAMLSVLGLGADAFAKLRDSITGTNRAFDLQALQLQTVHGQWQLLKMTMAGIGDEFAGGASGGVQLFFSSLKAMFDDPASAVLGSFAARIGHEVGRLLAQAGVWLQNEGPAAVAWVLDFFAKLPARAAAAENAITAFASRGLAFVIRGLQWLGTELQAAGSWLLNQWPTVWAGAIDWLINFGVQSVDIAQGFAAAFVVAFELIKMGLWPLTQAVTGLLGLFADLIGYVGMMQKTGAMSLLPGGKEISAQLGKVDLSAMAASMRKGIGAYGDFMNPETTSFAGLLNPEPYDNARAWLRTHQGALRRGGIDAGQWAGDQLWGAGAQAAGYGNAIQVVIYANDLGEVGRQTQAILDRQTGRDRRAPARGQ